MNPGRVIEIAEEARHLAVNRGFMEVSHKGERCGKVALDDIGAVIVTGHGTTVSTNLLAALAERNAMFVLPGRNFHPVGMLWPCASNYAQAERVEAQATAAKPLKKRLWQQVVKAKLAWQAAALAAIEQPDAPITALIGKVRSGDPDNVEAQAARRYWPLMFDISFRRDRDADDANAQLNFGYSILRSAAARAIAAAGLHPSLGLHHANAQNAFRLADDLMEPFRPVIDLAVSSLQQKDKKDVTPETKRYLVEVLWQDFPTNEGISPLTGILGRLAYSLVEVLTGDRDRLWLPPPSGTVLRKIAGR